MSFPCVFEPESPCSIQPHPTEPNRLHAYISDLTFTAFVPARLTHRALSNADSSTFSGLELHARLTGRTADLVELQETAFLQISTKPHSISNL